ncbi:MAG TPA: HAMP domain-containing sensor histidine kinase [Solirubrobacteraceae bacterium]|nr:HAMP domain-containing sensor histidine kinase [Solirubrobacteraceae bacterium]
MASGSTPPWSPPPEQHDAPGGDRWLHWFGWPVSTALGLRSRIVGVVIVTTVGTLAVAALALLGPLENSLRHAEQTTLRRELSRHTIDAFTRLNLGNVATSFAEQNALASAQTNLQNRISATVTVLGDPQTPYGTGATPLLPRDSDDNYSDVAVAFRRKTKPYYSFGTIDGRTYVRAAIPFVSDAGPHSDSREILYVLAVRKSVDQITAAVAVVRRAFITAALAGLALSLILGIPLAATLVRRLRRLREAALALTHETPGVELPVDRARDEVGDLARTLAVMQQRLREQEEARRAFVATASHELRTPLTSLDGMLELLDDDLQADHPDVQDARALLARARAQSRRLGRLAADLLDLSRLDARVELRSEPVELGELSRAVMAEFELGTAEKAVGLRLEDHGAAVWALGDPGSIARILRILLDNALRISPARSQLSIELARDGVASVTVTDEGPGVPEDERDQIFRRFHRGRDTQGKAGFGLGLAIGRELAQRMGGELRLEPTAGPGASFTLELPAAPSPARALSSARS